MTSTSHQLGTAHERGEDFVVVLTAAQIAGNAMRQFLPRGIRIGFQVAGRGHHEAGHAERALEPLLVDDALLDGAQRAGGGIGETFDRRDRLAARAVREHRTRIVRHIVDEDGARAALGAVAAQLGAREPQLVAQRPRERSCGITSTRRFWPFTLSVISRSTPPAVDGCPCRVAERKRYAEDEATAPAATTPLMKLRRETCAGETSVIVLPPMTDLKRPKDTRSLLPR